MSTEAMGLFINQLEVLWHSSLLTAKEPYLLDRNLCSSNLEGNQLNLSCVQDEICQKFVLEELRPGNVRSLRLQVLAFQLKEHDIKERRLPGLSWSRCCSCGGTWRRSCGVCQIRTPSPKVCRSSQNCRFAIRHIRTLKYTTQLYIIQFFFKLYFIAIVIT